MMCLQCKMIDVKDLNIVYKCPNQHCRSYSIYKFYKFYKLKMCFVKGKKINEAIFFFHFRETDRHYQ